MKDSLFPSQNPSHPIASPTVLGVVVLLLIWFSFSSLARGAEADVGLPVQWGHVAYRISEGDLDKRPSAIAQTRDGYLFIGTQTGLLRFDGVRFSSFDVQDSAHYLSKGVFSLRADPDGSLWVGTGAGLGHLKGGVLSAIREGSGRIGDIQFDKSGRLWFARSRTPDTKGGLCRLDGEGVQCFGSESCRFASSLAFTADTVWTGSSTGLCSLSDGKVTFIQVPGLENRRGLPGVLATLGTESGSLIFGTLTDKGLTQYNHSEFSPVPLPASNAEIASPVEIKRDDEGGLWVGTEDAGIFHVHAGQVDHINSDAGLSGDSVNNILQDAEGDMWIATSGGLDRFRRLPVTKIGLKQGIPGEQSTSVVASQDGRIFLGNPVGLHILTGAKVTSFQKSNGLFGDSVASMFQSSDGKTLWLGVDNKLVSYANGTFTDRTAEVDGQLHAIAAIRQTGDGVLWLLSLGRPAVLYRKVGDLPFKPVAIPKENPTLFEVDPKGNLWAAGFQGQFYKYVGDAFTPATKVTAAVKRFRFGQDSSLYVAATDGLHRFSNGIWKTLGEAEGLPCAQINDLIFDAQQNLWLSASCGFVEVKAKELSDWWSGGSSRVNAVLFGPSDGAQIDEPTILSPSTALAPDGSVFFVGNVPAQKIDPSRLQRNSVVPPVHVEEVIVDHRSYSVTPVIELPPLARDIEIRYSALSLQDPKKVLFRYSLSGFDKTVEDVGGRRSAFYSNLSPGRYTFHVMGSNNQGVWNTEGASVTLAIPPKYYQTVWFKLVLVLLLVMSIFLLIAARVRFVSEAIELRMGERLAERDRIARELHDTLLQGIQAIVLRFRVATNLLTPQEPVREMLLESLSRADDVMHEVRDKVQDLRQSSDRPGTLADDINRSAEELLSGSEEPVFELVVTGTQRPLNKAVRDELDAMAREAIFNSVQHAGATSLTCELQFSRKSFVLICADDGKGIPHDVLAAGSRVGHWGLVGIRERAAKIRATPSITSSDSGTVVRISLDGKYAYQSGTKLRFNIFSDVRRFLGVDE